MDCCHRLLCVAVTQWKHALAASSQNTCMTKRVCGLLPALPAAVRDLLLLSKRQATLLHLFQNFPKPCASRLLTRCS
ncbi:hypothetical protein IWX91DRAFT_352697 [Phyllosticta citricarpa]